MDEVSYTSKGEGKYLADRILQSANEAFKSQKWNEAAALYEQIYQQEPTPKINHLLVKSLYEADQMQHAYLIMMEDVNSYLDDEDHQKMLLKILLHNHQFMMAHIVATIFNEIPNWFSSSLAQAEHTMRQNSDFKQQYQSFYQLSSQTFIGQQRQFELGKQLPLNEWLTATRQLLVDPFVKPIIRVSLLEMIQRLRLSEIFNFRWLDDQVYRVDSHELHSLESMSITQQVKQRLLQVIHKNDPVTQKLYEESVQLQMTLLYPFVDRAIKDPSEWVDRLVFGDRIQSKELPIPYSVEWWQRKLSIITANMSGN